jgi:hypothetical protein
MAGLAREGKEMAASLSFVKKVAPKPMRPRATAAFPQSSEPTLSGRVSAKLSEAHLSNRRA